MSSAAVGALRNEDLPAFFVSADAHSVQWQRRFLTLQKVQLGGLMLAGVGGATSWTLSETPLSATIAAVGFGLALMARLVLFQQQPDRKWYDGRAAAESAKTLAWRFAVCARPFERSVEEGAAIERFTARILELTSDLPSLNRPAGSDRQVTDGMRELRRASIDERREVYRTHRLLDQQRWYSERSASHERRSRWWNRLLITLDAVAVLAAVARVAGWIEIDLLGVAATFSAAAVAWLQAKQHDVLARSYAVASQELAAIRERVDGAGSEDLWSAVVEQGEEAISREHTLWRASRSTP